MKQALVIFMTIFSLSMYCQDEIMSKKELKELAREQKRSEQERLKREHISIVKSILEKKHFVLEADYIDDGKGNRVPVSSTINFVVVDSSEAVLQLGSPYGHGWNGVGGVTVEGDVTKYDLNIIKGRRSTSYSLAVVIMSSMGIFDIHFNISETGMADATVRSTTSGQLRYSGMINQIKQSKVYKGATSY
jgi:hypothetical protein